MPDALMDDPRRTSQDLDLWVGLWRYAGWTGYIDSTTYAKVGDATHRNEHGQFGIGRKRQWVSDRCRALHNLGWITVVHEPNGGGIKILVHLAPDEHVDLRKFLDVTQDRFYTRAHDETKAVRAARAQHPAGETTTGSGSVTLAAPAAPTAPPAPATPDTAPSAATAAPAPGADAAAITAGQGPRMESHMGGVCKPIQGAAPENGGALYRARTRAREDHPGPQTVQRNAGAAGIDVGKAVTRPAPGVARGRHVAAADARPAQPAAPKPLPQRPGLHPRLLELFRAMGKAGVSVRWTKLTPAEESLLLELVGALSPAAMAEIASATTIAAVKHGKGKAHHVRAYLATWCQHAPITTTATPPTQLDSPATLEALAAAADWDLSHADRQRKRELLGPAGCAQHPGAPVDHASPSGWGLCLHCNTARRRTEQPAPGAVVGECTGDDGLCGLPAEAGHDQCGKHLDWLRCSSCYRVRIAPGAPGGLCATCAEYSDDITDDDHHAAYGDPYLNLSASDSERLVELDATSWNKAAGWDA
ncbi:hypothetical protein [Streptomyces hydrogenans]|uniref:hypothetical protein n=1 Tax=Streptomyces hydrogenans TaxID=1873719 RepID=UPI0038170EE7